MHTTFADLTSAAETRLRARWAMTPTPTMFSREDHEDTLRNEAEEIAQALIDEQNALTLWDIVRSYPRLLTEDRPDDGDENETNTLYDLARRIVYEAVYTYLVDGVIPNLLNEDDTPFACSVCHSLDEYAYCDDCGAPLCQEHVQATSASEWDGKVYCADCLPRHEAELA